jgi:hypothetical protein
MPLLLLFPLLAGGVGFGAGYFTNSAMSNVIKFAAVGGGAYLLYRYTTQGAK